MNNFNEELKSRITQEYKRTLLLNLFRKICIKMDNNNMFEIKIRKLFLQSYDRVKTSKKIIEHHFNFTLTDDEATIMSTWFAARLKKSSIRKPIPKETKLKLIASQHGLCAACGEPLSNDLSKVHVDHIVPWKLVGDELDNNFQALCETCNECKSASIDYMFRNMINLN